jgi:hypothetical protein
MSVKVGSKMLYCKVAGDKSSEEVVEVVAVQSEAQGGGVTIFIPSLKRTRDTLIERLSKLDLKDDYQLALKELVLIRKENERLREENERLRNETRRNINENERLSKVVSEKRDSCGDELRRQYEAEIDVLTRKNTTLRMEVERLGRENTEILRQKINCRVRHKNFVSTILQNVNGVCYDSHSAFGCVVRLTVQENSSLQQSEQNDDEDLAKYKLQLKTEQDVMKRNITEMNRLRTENEEMKRNAMETRQRNANEMERLRAVKNESTQHNTSLLVKQQAMAKELATLRAEMALMRQFLPTVDSVPVNPLVVMGSKI